MKKELVPPPAKSWQRQPDQSLDREKARGLESEVEPTQSRNLDQAMTLPDIPESQSLSQQDTERSDQTALLQSQPYQLRANRAPRYRCGTCGSHNCSCVHQVASEIPDKRLARGVDVPARELSVAKTPNHPQHMILAIQAREQEVPPLVHHVVVTLEKTYTSVDRGVAQHITFGLPQLPL